ncbi:MAG: copper-translocating P-type ATPase [Bacilli bacterium]|nr:copper-translocating P-type ATPase [Bacilli bacterium]
MKRKFNITGMMCAACQANVSRAVSKVDGVKECNVSLLANNMVVEYDEHTTNDDKIIIAVENAGYGASVFVNESIKKIQEKRRQELHRQLVRLFISLGLLVVLMVVSMGGMLFHEYGNGFLSASDPNFGIEALVSVTIQFLLFIPIAGIHFQYFVSGYKSLFKLHPNMNSLIALGSTISCLYSLFGFVVMVVSFSKGDLMTVHMYWMNMYVESAAMILVFVSIGKYFEKKATNKTTASIAEMIALTPDTAYLAVGEEVKEVLTESLQIGDVVFVKPGLSIPVDGIIVEGSGNIDESVITGESTPVHKGVGDKVIGATVNRNGSFRFQVTSIGKDTTISKIVSLVEEASESKAPIARLADRISMFFVPVVIGLAAITFGVWMALFSSGLVPTPATSNPVSMSLRFAITVLVISCPCALGLATPVAIMVGTGKGAENGVLIKSAEAFERLEKIDLVLFDKTGTLTKGEMTLVQTKVFAGEEREAIQIAASLERYSEHSISIAFLNLAKEQKIDLFPVDDFVEIPGRGIRGGDFAIGNASLMASLGVDIAAAQGDFQQISEEGLTAVFLAKQDRLIALFGIGDPLKDEAKESLRELKKKGKKISIVTGDNRKTASVIAHRLEIDDLHAEVLPEGKAGIIKKLQEEGKRVAFVGDGINDAPALAQADVGIAIGAGVDVAIDAADIVLVRSSVSDVSNALELSRRVVLNIKENLLWAFLYNVLLIPLAAGVAYPYVSMQPMYGSIAMSISSGTVVLNALRLRFFNKAKKKEKKDEQKANC